MADSYVIVIELALPSLSAMREFERKLLFRFRFSDLGGPCDDLGGPGPCDDLERNRLLLFDSVSSTETTDGRRSKAWSTSLIASGTCEFVEEVAGEGGGGRAALIRALEKRRDVELFEKPLGLNRPAVAVTWLLVLGFDSLWDCLFGASVDCEFPMMVWWGVGYCFAGLEAVRGEGEGQRQDIAMRILKLPCHAVSSPARGQRRATHEFSNMGMNTGSN